MGADAAIALSTLALALIMMTGYDAVWLIFATMAVRSAGAGIQMPAVSALIPQITPTRNLIRVNGINGSIQSAMALLAPAAAGALYAWASAATGGTAASLIPIFFIDVVTAVIGIGTGPSTGIDTPRPLSLRERESGASRGFEAGESATRVARRELHKRVSPLCGELDGTGKPAPIYSCPVKQLSDVCVAQRFEGEQKRA